jgi:glutamine synthetase adenylyltransferase
MKQSQKVGLTIAGTLLVAGAAYCAYRKREKILTVINELKNELVFKKETLTQKGKDKADSLINKLVEMLEKYSNPAYDVSLHAKDNEITALKKEIAELKAA